MTPEQHEMAQSISRERVADASRAVIADPRLKDVPELLMHLCDALAGESGVIIATLTAQETLTVEERDKLIELCAQKLRATAKIVMSKKPASSFDWEALRRQTLGGE